MACSSRQTSVNPVSDEFDVLKSIYVNEIEEVVEEKDNQIRRCILFTVKPNVDDGSANQYLSLQLEIDVPEDYPIESVIVKLKNPRGLCDDDMIVLESRLNSLLIENKGQAVLFDLIQVAQDFISRTTVPQLPCSICLNGFFHKEDIFVTNGCHHHFHSFCIGRFIQHILDEKTKERAALPPPLRDTVSNEVGCPMCRCPMKFDLNVLLKGSPPSGDDETEVFDWSSLKNPVEKTFKVLYEKQKQQGGLIDIDEEQKRLLVTEDTRLVVPVTSAEAAFNLNSVVTAEEKLNVHANDTNSSRVHKKPKNNWNRNFHGRGGGHYRNSDQQFYRNYHYAQQHHSTKPKAQHYNRQQPNETNSAADDVNVKVDAPEATKSELSEKTVEDSGSQQGL